jgi:predicted acyl esterase
VRRGGARAWAVALGAFAVLTVPSAGGLGGPATAARSDLGELKHVRIPSHDGVVLDGYVALPPGPRRKWPTVLIESPYLGSCTVVQAACTSQASWGDEVPPAASAALDATWGGYWDEWQEGATRQPEFFTNSLGFPLIHLVKAGYAVALVAVRGTGDSGGCFEFGGRNEQGDAKRVVDWLAAQPWSDSKVAMGGLSYMSYTTWQAAVQRPQALKATITGGELTHFWEFGFTPQGARQGASLTFETGYGTTFAAHAPGPFTHPTHFQPTPCADAVAANAHHEGDWITDSRPWQWYAERNLRPHMKNVRAAVLSAHGFADIGGHGFQDALMWESLPAQLPKRFVRGWWDHTWPSSYSTHTDTPVLNTAWGEPGWEDIVMEWLDAYVRDGQAPERTGVMDVSDGTSWHSIRSGWQHVPQEVLHLDGGVLRRTPSSASTTFLDVPVTSFNSASHPEGDVPAYDTAVCQPTTADGAVAAVYDSPPLAEKATVAGNPFAYLRLSSDQPQGLVSVAVYDVAPDARCGDPSSGTGMVGSRWLAHGAVDLAFYRDRFHATAFPVSSPQWVRIDLLDTAVTVPAGHRLRAVVSYGSAFEGYVGRMQDHPRITVHGDSQLVLPVLEGTVGGTRPTQRYPARPLVP